MLADLFLICGAIGIGIGFYFLTRIMARIYLNTMKNGDASTGAFDYAQASNDTWRTVAQVVGGAAFGLTFAWTILEDRDNDMRARRQGANQLYIDASKLLGGDNAVERSAGAYALRLVASDRPDYAMAVRDMLVILIAGDLDRSTGRNEPDLPFKRNKIVGLDTQTAIELLGRRAVQYDDAGRPLDLSGLYLVGGRFAKTSGFAGALFYNAILHRVDFSYAHLENARFDGAALSEWEAFGGAGTKQTGAWTSDTPFTAQWKSWERYRYLANFTSAYLNGATFTGTGLAGALFYRADLQSADFRRANLSRADFVGAHNLSPALFAGACYAHEARDQPKFDSSVSVVFDGPLPHPVDGKIYVDRCKE